MSQQLSLFDERQSAQPTQTKKNPAGWRQLAHNEMIQEGDRVLMKGPFGYDWVTVCVLTEFNSGPVGPELHAIRPI